MHVRIFNYLPLLWWPWVFHCRGTNCTWFGSDLVNGRVCFQYSIVESRIIFFFSCMLEKSTLIQEAESLPFILLVVLDPIKQNCCC